MPSLSKEGRSAARCATPKAPRAASYTMCQDTTLYGPRQPIDPLPRGWGVSLRHEPIECLEAARRRYHGGWTRPVTHGQVRSAAHGSLAGNPFIDANADSPLLSKMQHPASFASRPRTRTSARDFMGCSGGLDERQRRTVGSSAPTRFRRPMCALSCRSRGQERRTTPLRSPGEL